MLPASSAQDFVPHSYLPTQIFKSVKTEAHCTTLWYRANYTWAWHVPFMPGNKWLEFQEIPSQQKYLSPPNAARTWNYHCWSKPRRPVWRQFHHQNMKTPGYSSNHPEWLQTHPVFKHRCHLSWSLSKCTNAQAIVTTMGHGTMPAIAFSQQYAACIRMV